MKLGVISDIHANAPALSAVLVELDAQDVDAIVCLGDIIGVLGFPSETLHLIESNVDVCIRGNHDTRICDDRDWMPATDYEAVEYNQTISELSDEQLDWITSLPEIETFNEALLAHSRPVDGKATGTEDGDTGVFPRDFVSIGADYLDGTHMYLFLGHTHRQHGVNLSRFDGVDGIVLNPGSVGFPYESKDGELVGEASYAIVDTDTNEFSLKSVAYDSTPVFEQLEEHGLAKYAVATRGDSEPKYR